MKKIFFTIVMATVLVATEVRAGNMKEFFSKHGISYNYSKGRAFSSQSHGYYVGGSLYARMPIEEYQLFDVRGPRLKAGCGGIDMFMGSIAFIKKDELVKALRSIASNAAGYAFNLALQTFVPQIYNTINKLKGKLLII